MRSSHAALLAIALLAAAPALSAQDPQSRLWDAAMAGDTAAIRAAIHEGAKIDSLDTRRNANGRFALNWAAWYNRVDAVKLLLELKAALEAVNRTGFTALHHAAESGSLDVARVLLAAGADPDHTNDMGFTPAFTATERGHPEIAQLLDEASRKKKK
jgi:ankyrin repeat protein